MTIAPDAITANAEFRQYMLAVMLYTDWLPRYGAIVMPEYFPVKSEQLFVAWLNEYWNKYNTVPDPGYVADHLANEVVTTIQTFAAVDLRYAADTLLDFCRVQAMKMSILESVEDIQEGDLHTPLERVKAAQKVGVDRADLGLELVADVSNWLYDEIHGKKYPTGFPSIDYVLDGGLIGGEYGLIEAPPGAGKTTVLINLGYALAGLFGATNVLHVTYELSVSKTLKRYGARATGIRVMRGENDFDETNFVSQLQARAKAQMRGRVRVINPGKRISDIKRAMDSLAHDNFKTGALIVDYADLMTAPRKRKDERFELADIARGLRELGEEYNIPVWSATQAGRQAFHKATIDMSDISEAIEKAAVADVILSLSQTKDEEQLGVARLYAAKIRDGEGQIYVEVTIDRKRQIIMEKHLG